MVKITENKTKKIAIKSAYMGGENLLLDEEDGEAIDLYKILRDNFGDGVSFSIAVTYKKDTE
jgi:hypothetical protein